MTDDHCIVTRYELSTREKQLKKGFFSSNKIKQETKSTHQNNFQNSVYDPKIEDLISKAINEDSNRKRLNSTNNAQINNNYNPMNLIYTQNKILERNVDVLHETQKSVHDLLVYNIKNNSQNQANNVNNNLKNEILNENRKLIQEMIEPLYKNMVFIKGAIENSKSNNEQEFIREKGIDFTKNSISEHRTKEMLQKNQVQPLNNKDTVISKAIEDIKSTVNNLNNGIVKMESDFNDNLKRIVETNEKKNLLNIIGNGINEQSQKRGNLFAKDQKVSVFQFSSKSLDEFNYTEFKNDLLDIMNEKDRIFNDFISNKIEFPKYKDTEKISFTYKLDFDEKPINNLNQSKSEKSKEKIKNEISKNNSKIQRINPPQKIIQSDSIYSNKPKNVFLDNYYERNTNKGLNIVENNPYENQTQIIENSIGSNQMMNQNRNLENTKLDNSKDTYSLSNNNKVFKLEQSMSTKNTNSTPTTNKHLFNSTKQRIGNLQNQGIQENEEKIVESNNETESKNKGTDQVNKTLKIVQEESKNIKSNVSRQGIFEVETSEKEKNKSSALHDIVSKLIIEKFLNKGDKIIPDNKNKPLKSDINLYPFNFHEHQIYSISENMIRDMIISLKNNKNKNLNKEKLEKNNVESKENEEEKKINQEIEENKKNEERIYEVHKLIENEVSKKLREEVINQNVELESKMKSLYEKLELIDTNIRNQNENIIKNNEIREEMIQENQNSNSREADLNSIIEKVSKQIKENLNINITLQNPQNSYQEPLRIHRNTVVVNEQKFEINNKSIDSDRKQSPSKRSIRSEYSHPFSNENRNQDFNLEIDQPYMYNLEEYDVSSESHITESKRDFQIAEKSETENIHQNINLNVSENTYSEGQIITNNEIKLSTPLSKTDSSNESQQIHDNNYNSAVFEILKSLDHKNEDHMNLLKKLGLYNSEEHKEFQAQFLKGNEDYLTGPNSKNGNQTNTNNVYASFGNNAFNFINSPHDVAESQRSYNNTFSYRNNRLINNNDNELNIRNLDPLINRIHTISEGESESNYTNNDKSISSISNHKKI